MVRMMEKLGLNKSFFGRALNTSMGWWLAQAFAGHSLLIKQIEAGQTFCSTVDLCVDLVI